MRAYDSLHDNRNGRSSDVNITVRPAVAGDEATIVGLIQELARVFEDTSPSTPADARAFLAREGNGALLAEVEGAPVGVVTYSIHPGLYHGGTWGLIEELIVTEAARGRGVGHALAEAAVRVLVAAGCREAGVQTDTDNEVAKHLYRAHGFVDESLALERHFKKG
jgi:ribosomal protein S18 acetylase RimI-like enzyme